MALKFINPSRAYNSNSNSVTFWGYDATVEVAFRIDNDAIQHVSSLMTRDENSVLAAFDSNRPRIERAAGEAYSRSQRSMLLLSRSDF